MAKKVKNKSDSFNNPFSNLKGLSVSSQQKVAVEKKPLPREAKPEAVQESTPEPVDADEQFAQAMGQLGVQRTEQDDVLEKSAPGRPIYSSTIEPVQQSASEQIQGGSRRQMRKAAKKMGEPEATLDLHGVAAADAVRKVEWFLENAVFHGCRFVRIVTGKGAHSTMGPVIKPLVEEYLSGPGLRFVVAWVQALNNQGGVGALLVELQAPDDVC